MASFPDKWPTDGGTISSNYGVRTGPIEGGYDWHPGLDIAVDFGTPVYATAAGTIEQAGWNGGYGRYVRINHGNGYKTAYGHMSGIALLQGRGSSKARLSALSAVQATVQVRIFIMRYWLTDRISIRSMC